jgi:hypothetical protein
MTTQRRERPGSTSARRRRGAEPEGKGSNGLGVSPLGLALGAGGALVAVLGFWLISRGDITAAPILLVLAYLVLFPVALVLRGDGSRGG